MHTRSASVSWARRFVYETVHTLNDYIEAVRRRRAMFHPPEQARSTRKGYTIVPVGAALHGAQIHALSLSMDSSSLLSAGSEG